MTHFKLDNMITTSRGLPPCSLTIDDSGATAIYSDTDMQMKLVNELRDCAGIPVFDQQEGLYQRLSVRANVTFYHKWFGCRTPLPEILVMFDLHRCAQKPLHHCSVSECRRVYFAKAFMSGVHPMVFQEPIHGVDVQTTDRFLNMLQKMMESGRPVLVLVSTMEHALLLGDSAYKLQENGLHPIEVDDGDDVTFAAENSDAQTPNQLFKISAKVGDKMILFDPHEIDYIESQEGKAMMVINDESYPMEATLTEIEKKLAFYGFYRCHRFYIVNLQKVREIVTWSKNTYSLRINNPLQSTIPLSRSKIGDIQAKFNLA